MTTLPISLDEDLKSFVDESIDTGAFHNASELVSVALKNFQAEGAAQLARLTALRKAISVGLEQADRGEFVGFNADSIMEESRAARASDRH